MTKSLVLQNVTAHYGRTQVLQDLNLEVGAGQFVSLLGASGCGKSTVMGLLERYVCVLLVISLLLFSSFLLLFGLKTVAPQCDYRH